MTFQTLCVDCTFIWHVRLKNKVVDPSYQKSIHQDRNRLAIISRLLFDKKWEVRNKCVAAKLTAENIINHANIKPAGKNIQYIGIGIIRNRGWLCCASCKLQLTL